MTKRKDGTWQETLLIDGKRKYFYGKTKAEVLRKIQAFQQSAEDGPTVSDALDIWVEEKSKTVTFKTAEGYAAPIKRIKKAMGDTLAKDVTPHMLQTFVDGIAKQGFKRTTVQRPLDVLNMLFDWLITRPGSVIRDNPCSSVRMPSGLAQQSRELAPKKYVDLVKASGDVEFSLFPFFIMYSGLRDGEVLALRREDITEDSILVTKSLSWQHNKPVIKETKTKAGVRSVVLLDPLKEKLPKEWSGYLFSSDGGETPLTQTEFRNRWRKYCREAGIAIPTVTEHKSKGKNNRTFQKTTWEYPIVPYQLRHEFASICLDAGLNPKDLQDIMGHASPITAQKIYAHILESRREKNVEKLREYVKMM